MIGNQLLQGDCLEVMRELPDNSVDLICTDPPYFKVKSRGDDKFNWWDHQWDKPEGFLAWIDQLAAQWARILKPNGSLYCFASPRMAARVEVTLGERLNVVNRITWQKPPFATKAEMFRKEDLRGFFPASEAIIFCEHYGADNIAKGEAGYWSKCDEAARDIWGNYIKQVRSAHGLTAKQLTEVIGAYGRVNHGGACSNWEQGKNCPTPEHYAKLQQSFPGHFRREYEDLRREYEDLRRPFAVSADVPYTDVWTFPTVQSYPGKHPCEKPAAMLEHIISASSRPGAVVLDCFAGSGSTLVAAKRLGRQYLGIEIDPHWCDVARGKLGEVQDFVTLEQRVAWLETQVQAQGAKLRKIEAHQQMSIFDALGATP
jgi:site-specific DNA-methyltransferase (adenine-specific)